MADELLARVNQTLTQLAPADPAYDLIADLYADIVHLQRDANAYANLVEAARDVVADGDDWPMAMVRLSACLAIIDDRDPLSVFTKEG